MMMKVEEIQMFCYTTGGITGGKPAEPKNTNSFLDKLSDILDEE